MSEENAAGGFVGDEELLAEEVKVARLIVSYRGLELEVIEFAGTIKFDPLLEKSCRKCKKVAKGGYIQIANKVIDIVDVDHGWLTHAHESLREKIVNSPIVLKRLNAELKRIEVEMPILKFSRSGVCDDCLDKIDVYLRSNKSL